MKNLVFRFYLTVALCWNGSSAERSANGYFYDKPEGTLFDESPGTSQLSNSAATIFPPVPPAVEYFQQLQQQPAPTLDTGDTLQIVPAKLIYAHTQSIIPNVNFGFQQESLQNEQNYENNANFAQAQPVYTVSSGDNLQPIAFIAQDASQAYSSAQSPCGPEPIVAQFNPSLVDLSNGGPLTRFITTCGPNNDCSTITLQSDLNRQLGAQQQLPKTSYQVDIQPGYPAFPAERRASNIVINAVESPVVRPPSRRLIEYSEIERGDAYN